MKIKELVLALLMLGLNFATQLSIPPDQPICNLYGIIRLFGTVAAIIAAAYAGFTLTSSHVHKEREEAKGLLGGVFVGLIVIWLAPLVVTSLVGASSICGWS